MELMSRCAVAYIRVPDESESPAEQREAIETWAQREQVQVASWQTDRGVCGRTPIAERPALVAAYRAIREHGAGILVAANAERFSQDELVGWLIARAAIAEGAMLETADGTQAAPAPSASFTRGAVDLARAYDRVILRSKIRAAFAEKRARGERVGNVPYGYRLAEDGVHVEPHEPEQEVVATVHRLRGEGLSQRAIARWLAEHGIAGRTGAPLGQTQVANILRSA